MRVKKERDLADKLMYASQGKLMLYRLRKHKLAHIGGIALLIFYTIALLADFIAPYSTGLRFKEYLYTSPTRIHLISKEHGLRSPFIYGLEEKLNTKTYKYDYIEKKDKEYKVEFFYRVEEPYKLLGLITLNHKLFGVRGQPIFLFGTDRLGRDMFSRALHASRVSLFVGFGGVIISFFLGIFLGGISGYFGGIVDNAIQRVVELFMSIPHIPLWIALSAAVPQEWSGIQTYFAITLILAFVGWTGLARVVRGKIIALREEDYVCAAQISGVKELKIIFRHLLPGFVGYLIVHVTLAVPNMILGETTLSFLGLGIQPPDVSWGSMLQDAQDILVLANYPWYLIPCVLVIVTVLMFNFVGDGLRDAADPYSQ